MSKYQEALDCIKRFYAESEHYDEENIRLLQELVDKATPKKTIPLKDTLYFTYMRFCPVCRSSSPFTYAYCGYCGQALDRSDEDDK